ncbi:cupin fold metalloprotein, WbuC family [Xylanibacter ruminicola]|uniref:Cupin fold metalloprotein, WbuC family n=1 Tax=Xylanibacter ruminicola TaxID=839 RepID=A0A1H4C5J4_XYLRU|nr:WbuC family cupin fold metalloprotein [Xylanibacter ruminicola]SEA55654.1 cupin fold metalloprotein, WbuC family [Xylanibacter ruminicola]
MVDKITQAILDELTAKAKESPRLRMNMDLRDSETDQSQRMLNAIEPGSVLPIHRHQKTSETMVCLRGRLQVEFYDELERMCTESFVIEPGGANVAVSIPMGQWHTVHALESGTCILEMKNGGYEPIGSEDILSL